MFNVRANTGMAFQPIATCECLPETWTHRVNRRVSRPGAAPRSSLPTAGTRLSRKASRWNIAAPICSPEKPSGRISIRFILNFEGSVGAGSPQQRLKRTRSPTASTASFCCATEARNTKIKDKDALLALIKAFNDYFIEEYCAVDRDRLIGVAVMPDIGAERRHRRDETVQRRRFQGGAAADVSERQKHADAGGR